MAANGAALVHQRDGKYVVSRRPEEVPTSLLHELYGTIESLLSHDDIGQLEALGKLLEEDRFRALGAYSGSVSLSYQAMVQAACFQYQPQLGGDRLERTMLLCEYLQRLFPQSQVAGNLVASIHRDLGWDARGGGYAGSVTEAGWETFRREMQLAKQAVVDLLAAPQPMAPTYKAAIDIAMTTGNGLDAPRRLAQLILASDHALNSQLHHAIAFLLLPRWHGEPGMSENYIESACKRAPPTLQDAMYAQQIAMMVPALGYNPPISTQMKVDLARLLKGTKDYYELRDDADLVDVVILILTVEGDNEAVRELLELRASKRMLPSEHAAVRASTFRQIEKIIGDRN